MRLLVIGSGGREHALVWKLAQSPHVRQMWCAPGNAGIASERLAKTGAPVECVPIGAEDLAGLLKFARDNGAEFTVVGPDNPLALGVVDLFQGHGLRIWGPNQRAAQFESSKAFAQEFMERHGIPTARAGAFADPAAARQFAATLAGRCAVKADGLALGKGVILCADIPAAHRAIDDILVEKTFGAAGGKIVIQELLEGTEISLHALCDGRTARLFPTAQDHKRALDGDRGLNTGGMGTYCPAPFLDDAQVAQVGAQILNPWLKGCAEEGIDFRGILYPGVMLTSQGPRVLEFNARFGDPETQVYLTRLQSDLVELLHASAEGTLDRIEPVWSPQVSVCVVMASGGYPGSYPKGKPISGLEEASAHPETKVFHAGTAFVDGRIVTAGGRVLGVTALGNDLAAARAAAYAAVGKIHFEGAQYRRDIAAQGLRHRTWNLEAVARFAVWLVFSLAAGLVAMAALHHYGPKLSLAQEKFSGFLISTVSFQGASLWLTHFLIQRHGLSWGEFLGWRKPNLRPALALGIATGALVLPLIYLLNAMSEHLLTLLQGPPEMQPTVQILQLTVGFAQRTAFGVAAIVIAPVCEEILFRGILYRLIKQLGWPKVALVTSSLFFGVIHSNPMTLVPLSVLALVLAVLYDRTDNLMAPITAHSLFNAVNFTWFLIHPK